MNIYAIIVEATMPFDRLPYDKLPTTSSGSGALAEPVEAGEWVVGTLDWVDAIHPYSRMHGVGAHGIRPSTSFAALRTGAQGADRWLSPSKPTKKAGSKFPAFLIVRDQVIRYQETGYPNCLIT